MWQSRADRYVMTMWSRHVINTVWLWALLESVYSITNFKGTGYGHAESVRRIINSKIQTQKQPFGNIQMAVFVFGWWKINEFAQNVGSICMKNILKNTKNIENYTKQPIAQIKKNMLGIVKSVQKRKRNISKFFPWCW